MKGLLIFVSTYEEVHVENHGVVDREELRSKINEDLKNYEGDKQVLECCGRYNLSIDGQESGWYEFLIIE